MIAFGLKKFMYGDGNVKCLIEREVGEMSKQFRWAQLILLVSNCCVYFVKICNGSEFLLVFDNELNLNWMKIELESTSSAKLMNYKKC